MNIYNRIKRRLSIEFTTVKHRLVGSNHQCNICGFKCDRFASDGWHENVRCPKCGSDVRKRLFVATIFEYKNGKYLEESFRNKSILHFAPERLITRLIEKHCGEYKTADYLTDGYQYEKLDYVIDISNMAEIGSSTFDTLIAMDVLEHVEDDKAAIAEIFRVLKPGGTCFLTVPQKDNLATTYEDPSITEPQDREIHFGQFDHLRIYGADFENFLQVEGFDVELINDSNFSEDSVEFHVLKPPVLSLNPLATNHRVVYLGMKPL
jgi:predicted SAM-dependent methyltransferase